MYSNVNRSRMCQGTLGPNRPIARGYAWHTPNTIKDIVNRLNILFSLVDINSKISLKLVIT